MALEMLTRKAGPLPMWGWGAIGLGAALTYALVKQRKAADSSQQDQAVTEVPSDQVPDFISQVSVTNVEPPTTGTPPPSTGTTSPPRTTLPQPITSPPVATKPKPVVSKPVPKAPTTKKTPAKPTSYKVQHGDTLSSIAKKYGTTWQALWTYNTTAGNRPADTIKTLKSRGPNLLYAGETILIPPKK
jgi:nucleoid-associated protein YgaU